MSASHRLKHLLQVKGLCIKKYKREDDLNSPINFHFADCIGSNQCVIRLAITANPTMLYIVILIIL